MHQAFIEMKDHGGPEVLRLRSGYITGPGPSQILVRQTAIGVNFHDIYVRTGLYRTLALPGTPGLEAVGIVDACGEAVSHIAVGDRIGWVSPGYGGYASHRLLDAALAIRLPHGWSDIELAGSLMKMLTTCMLVHHVRQVKAGDHVLVHAAAGGVGQLLCAWAKALGASVIGTVGSAVKGDAARQAGADHILHYRNQDVVHGVAEITRGAGVDVAYDAIGRDTFLTSMQCLGYAGTLVNYGQASGPVAPFTPDLLAARSLGVVRPIVFHYLRSSEQRAAMTQETFAALDAGILRPLPPRTFPLAEAADAHRLLESGQSPGALVLVPEESSHDL